MAVSVDHLRLPTGNDLNLLLVGMTGQGKSLTGNSVLNRNRFLSSGGFQSVTREVPVDDIDARIDGRILTVVDTPGFSDTRAGDENERKALLANGIAHTLIQCPLGFDAIVLVIAYNRFEKRTQDILKHWMEQIGEEAFLTHGIVILTFGDWFRQEHPGISARRWWIQQSIHHKWFWDKCGQRCVVFNNKTTDFVERRQQLYDLVTSIDRMRNGNKHIPHMCQPSGAGHERLIISRDQCWKIRNFDKYFCLLRQSLEYLGAESDVEIRRDLTEQINEDALQMSNDLSQGDNEAIYNSIRTELSTVIENVRKLQEYDQEYERIRMDTIDVIVRIRSHLSNLISKTEYREWLVHTCRNVAAGLLALGAVGVAAVQAPAALGAGAVVVTVVGVARWLKGKLFG